jgi:hypothetical protein
VDFFGQKLPSFGIYYIILIMNKNIIIAVIVLLGLGGGGFFYYTSQQKPITPVDGQSQSSLDGFQNIKGEIIKINNKTVEVKTPDQGNKTFEIADNTNINKLLPSDYKEVMVASQNIRVQDVKNDIPTTIVLQVPSRRVVTNDSNNTGNNRQQAQGINVNGGGQGGRGQGGGNGRGGQRNGSGNNQAQNFNGKIDAFSETTLVIKQNNDETKRFTLDSAVTYKKQETLTIGDLKVGNKISANGGVRDNKLNIRSVILE